MQTTSVGFRDILKGTSVYSLAVVANKATSFVFLPLYTRYLSPDDYGVLELLSLTAFILTTLVFMRLGDTLFYFYTNTACDSQKSQVVCTIFVTSVALGGLCALAGCAAADTCSRAVFETARYAPAFRIVFVTAGLSFAVEMGYAYLRLKDRRLQYVWLSTINLVLGAAGNVVLLIVFHLGVWAMLWSSAITTALTAGISAVMIAKEVWPGRAFSLRLSRSVVAYAFPLGLAGVGVFVLNFADRYFLQRYVTLSEVGVYALAYKIGMLVAYVQTPFDTYWRSQMYSIWNQVGGEKVYVRALTYLQLCLGFVALALAVLTEPMLRLTVPQAYWPAALLVPWIAAAYVIRAVGGQFRCVFFLMGRPKSELIVTGSGALICLAGYAVLIPRFGIWGAVVSTVLGFAWMYVLGLWQAQRTHRLAFEHRRIGIAAGTAVVFVVLSHMVRQSSPWADLTIGLVLLGAYPCVLFLLRFPQTDETSAICALLRAFSSTIRHAAVPARN